MNFRSTIAVVATSLLGATAAQAQIFNTGIGDINAGWSVDGPAQRVTVGAQTQVTGFGVWLSTVTSQIATANQDFKFFIVDLGTNTKVYESTKNVTLTTTSTLTSTSPFSLTLNAGTQYAFGVLGLSGNFHQTSLFRDGLTLTQGNLSVVPVNGLLSFAGTGASGPTATGVLFDRTLALQIEGGPSNVVPEPSTYALMGAGLLGLAGARRRRKA